MNANAVESLPIQCAENPLIPAGDHSGTTLQQMPEPNFGFIKGYCTTLNQNPTSFERLPDVPVTVIADWPIAAESLTVSVNVLVEVVGLGLNTAVTPLGIPLALRVTSWLKPPAGTITIVSVPLPPCATVRVFGDTVSVKLPAPSTVSVSAVPAFRPPEVPATVTVAVPFFASAPAVRNKVLFEVAGSGLKEAVTPFGSPEVTSVTSPKNPLTGITVTILLPLAPPCVMVTALGDAERLKPGATVFTVRLRVAVLVSVPEVPVIVTVTVPVAAAALAVKLSRLLLVAGLGLNTADTPLGKPDAETVTLPLKPFVGVMVIVLVPRPPCVIVRLLGLAVSVKPAGQLFTRL